MDGSFAKETGKPAIKKDDYYSKTKSNRNRCRRLEARVQVLESCLEQVVRVLSEQGLADMAPELLRSLQGSVVRAEAMDGSRSQRSSGERDDDLTMEGSFVGSGAAERP